MSIIVETPVAVIARALVKVWWSLQTEAVVVVDAGLNDR